MDIKLLPKEIFKKNLYLILFLLSANILGLIFKYYFDYDTAYGLIALFDFNTEKNIPTLYSSIALIIVSILLWSTSKGSQVKGQVLHIAFLYKIAILCLYI